ncbi:MAG: HPr(Ser) kinase/phosphatase [Streptococcaceae bacterium]|nr:HPr(Ser) kinase/phosphatase [Streptococcaceae bacterium]
MSDFVRVLELVEKLKLEVIVGEQKALEQKIIASDISRPGLELTGYFNYYASNCLQMFGRKELSFMSHMISEKKLKILKEMFAKGLPAIIISRGLNCPKEFIIAAKEAKIAVLRSPLATSRLVGVITNFLDERLAKRVSIHGVLMDIYGLGILLQGDSGIGKSETALELIKNGHRLIVDDRVDVYQKDELTLIGESPEILKHLLEIRGVGIIDVMNLFGTSSVRKAMQIQLVIYLEQWAKGKNYDRLGSDTVMISIADVNVAQIRVPVKTGRNLSTIIEVAAMNFRANTMGFDATEKFEQRLTQLIKENSTKKKRRL